MCDFFPGHLLLATHRDDMASEILTHQIAEGAFSHVQIKNNLKDRLNEIESSLPEDFAWNVYLLQVPDGEELWKLNYLQSAYTQLRSEALLLQLNAAKNESDRMQVMERMLGGDIPTVYFSMDNFVSLNGTVSLDPIHSTYRTSLNVPTGPTGLNETIAIIDSGIDPSLGLTSSHKSRNFADDSNPTNVDDQIGHGSVIAQIIDDLVPNADLIIHKIGDQNPTSEFNVLAALISCSGASVINMSLAFSLSARSCAVCGRGQSHSSRSMVFQVMLEEFLRCEPDAIIVAAAGNGGASELDFPARYDFVVAVGALDSKGNLPSYSNYGATAHGGVPHDNLYFAPGGGNGEFVANSTFGSVTVNHEGTSFAAPYVSALVALYRSSPSVSKNRDDVLNHLRASADPKAISGYLKSEHGNGLVQI